MKNLFFTTSLFVLAFTYNSGVIAKVLPVNEEVESMDSLILQNNDINDLSGLSVGIVKTDGLSYIYCFGKEYIDIKYNLIYGTFQPFTSVAKLFVGVEVFELNEELKIIGTGSRQGSLSVVYLNSW